MFLSSKINVAVLRGGAPGGYNDSLKSGQHVLRVLREMPETYEPVDIFISKKGEWHFEGLVLEPHETLRYADVVWNALGSSDGEDGQLQSLLQGLKIPYTGSSAVSSALSMNHQTARDLYRMHSLPTLESRVIDKKDFNTDELIDIFQNFPHPVRVRSTRDQGKVSVVYSFQELEQAVEEALSRSSRVLVEEFIKGDQASCTVLEEAKGERIYAFIPSSKSILSTEESGKIGEMARQAHQVLGLRHYSSSDFVVTPKKNIYITETNSLPALHEDSSVHDSLLSTGWRPRDFVDHVLKLAM